MGRIRKDDSTGRYRVCRECRECRTRYLPKMIEIQMRADFLVGNRRGHQVWKAVSLIFPCMRNQRK